MAEKTTNYGLTKPLPEEFYDIGVQNDNMDIIDAELKKQADYTNIGLKQRDRVVNLLDNSWFVNPINQRGQTSYVGANTYTIDRWYIGGSNNKVTVGNGCVKSETTVGSSYATIAQKVANCTQYAGKTLTFAACLRSNVTPRVYAYNGDTGIQAVAGVSGDYQVLVCTFTVPSDIAEGALTVRIQSKSTTVGDYVEAQWAALYEGEYTVNTLPAYQYKGYAVELAECRRYYVPNVYESDTPADTEKMWMDGKVSKSGDTMTGGLKFTDPSGGTNVTTFAEYNNEVLVRNHADTSNYVDLVFGTASDIHLRGLSSGTYFTKTLLHTGNISNFGLAKVATGSYKGTNSSGSTYPNSLTFDFEPKLLIVYGLNDDSQSCNAPMILVNNFNGVRQSNSDTYPTSWSKINVTWGKTVKWYSTSSAKMQQNDSATTYAYVAIG